MTLGIVSNTDDIMGRHADTHHLWTLTKQSCIPVTIIKFAVEQIPLPLLHSIEFPHMQRRGIRHASYSYPDLLLLLFGRPLNLVRGRLVPT